MKTKQALAALVLVAAAALSSPAFAQRTSGYPEGSIFTQAPRPPVAASRSPETAEAVTLSPRNPLDAPDAGNVWKPSNRDAGNLSVERWQQYMERRKALESHQ